MLFRSRQGTKAAVMDNQIPEDIKSRRSGELIELGERMSKEFREYYIDKTVKALMEESVEIDGEQYYTGYTKEYVKVAVKTKKNLSNQFVEGKIIRSLTEDVFLLVEF